MTRNIDIGILSVHLSVTFQYFSTVWKQLNVLSQFLQSINQQNFYSAPYKTWTAALDNVNM